MPPRPSLLARAAAARPDTALTPAAAVARDHRKLCGGWEGSGGGEGREYRVPMLVRTLSRAAFSAFSVDESLLKTSSSEDRAAAWRGSDISACAPGTWPSFPGLFSMRSWWGSTHFKWPVGYGSKPTMTTTSTATPENDGQVFGFVRTSPCGRTILSGACFQAIFARRESGEGRPGQRHASQRQKKGFSSRLCVCVCVGARAGVYACVCVCACLLACVCSCLRVILVDVDRALPGSPTEGP